MNNSPSEQLSAEERPRYRITAVSAMTGLSAPTLRAWERRYGIPQPTRGDNTYRLYSSRDVQIIRYMQSLRTAGHAPSEAAQLTLQAIEEERISGETSPQDHHPPQLTFEQLREELLEAIEALRLDQVTQLFERSLSLGSAWTIYRELIVPSLRCVGDQWESGVLEVAQEHFFSEQVRGFLERLLRLLTPPHEAPVLLLACVMEEQHELPLRGLALLAAHLGWRSVILGQRTPPDAVTRSIELLKPDAIGLSMVCTSPLGEKFSSAKRTEWAQQLAVRYREACGKTPWIIGGTGALKMRQFFEAEGAVVADDDHMLRHFLIQNTPNRAFST